MDGLGILSLGVLLLLLIPIVAIDVRRRRIPFWLSGVMGAVGFGYSLIRQPHLPAAAWTLGQAVATALILALVLGGLGRVRPQARMGGGDAGFLVGASLWVGLEGALAVLLLAGLALAAVALLRRGPEGRGVEHAFAPMLAASLLVVAAAFETVR